MLMTESNALKTHLGMKTMTRRLSGLEYINKNPDAFRQYTDEPNAIGEGVFYRNGVKGAAQILTRCRYVPGSTFWVKENWRTDRRFDKTKSLDIPEGAPIWHEADGLAHGGPEYEWGRLRPSIYMREWMSRSRCLVTALRLERLHAIDGRDATAEGIEWGEELVLGVLIGAYRHDPSSSESFAEPVEAFADLWDSINRQDAAVGFQPMGLGDLLRQSGITLTSAALGTRGWLFGYIGNQHVPSIS